jgi:hypothetical protein
VLDGHWIKTLPSRLDNRDLARLAAAGATPAGPPPLPAPSGTVIELERIVNASGNLSVGGHIISAGLPLAGQQVTLRLDGPVAHILSGATMVRTVACSVDDTDELAVSGLAWLGFCRRWLLGSPPDASAIRRIVGAGCGRCR